MATRRRGDNRRFRVSVAGGFVIARSTSLPFVVAHARALALRGYCAFIADQLGRIVEVRRAPEAFSVTSTDNPDWLASCRVLLAEHG